MGKEIVLNGDGSSIFYNAEERLNEIKSVIEPELIKIKRVIEVNNQKMYPQKLNFISHITNILDANLRLKPLIRYDYAILIDPYTLQEYSNAFFRLMIFIRSYYPEFIANKQTFSAFCGFSVSVYNALQNSPDGDIVSIIESINDSCIEVNLTAAQSGSISGTTTINRMKAKGAGHDLQIKSESEQSGNITFVLDNDMVKKQLASVFGNKMIENKKTK